MHSALNFIVKLYNAVCSYEHNKKNLETNSVGRKADIYNLKKAILESAGLLHEDIETIINNLEPQSATTQAIESKIPAGYFIDYVRVRSDMLIACAKLRTGLLNRSQLRSHLHQVLAEPAHSKENLLRDMITDRDEAITHLNNEVNSLRNQYNSVNPSTKAGLSANNETLINPVPPSSFFSAASIKNVQPVVTGQNEFNPKASPVGIVEIDKPTP